MLLKTGWFADNMLCHMGFVFTIRLIHLSAVIVDVALLPSNRASMVAGLITTTVSSPMDVIKTRLMNESGGSKYSGTFDCMFKVCMQYSE